MNARITAVFSWSEQTLGGVTDTTLADSTAWQRVFAKVIAGLRSLALTMF